MRLLYRIQASLFALVLSTVGAQPAPGSTEKQEEAAMPKAAASVPLAAVKEFIAPTYPDEALKKGLSAEADMFVRISAQGKIESIEKITVTPTEPAFEKALRDIAARWTFRRGVDGRCEVRSYVGLVKVWFDLRDGKPAISYGRVTDPLSAMRQTTRLANFPDVQRAAAENYPLWPRMKEVEADVAVATDFSGDTGEPKLIRASVADLLNGYVSSEFEAIFRNSAELAMSRAILQVEPENAGKIIRHCSILSFRLN